MIPWWGWALAVYLGIGAYVAHGAVGAAVVELRLEGMWPPPAEVGRRVRLALGADAAGVTVAWLPLFLVWLARYLRHGNHG